MEALICSAVQYNIAWHNFNAVICWAAGRRQENWNWFVRVMVSVSPDNDTVSFI